MNQLARIGKVEILKGGYLDVQQYRATAQVTCMCTDTMMQVIITIVTPMAHQYVDQCVGRRHILYVTRSLMIGCWLIKGMEADQ